MASVRLEELQKAVNSLLEANGLFLNAKNDSPEQKAFRDACIQRFEFCVELSWKVSMKLLGSTTLAAKPAVREMGRNGLVTDVAAWLDYVEARNETSHSYDEVVASKVYNRVPGFLQSAQELLTKLSTL